ncbi:hypothetical protein AUEXF2481DRAFT_33210 [Aureobasidium subglaciale EXF-2481]|uniref:Phosphatidate phosphatase APP1 catalytic domain-containing protein n=1 Tax=Aureobasidium subglaciale (strain EXF-2481) TaxID=1043005 RepID=A0A074Y5M9_AURSE|nr:uncharacterized protein AUEXF2481DRAFT_33210 [Aureobasidium subglaciale EXF-2481]KAI5198509.1 hypothetical protein E4T38_07463 [Aureobasidium subglaciale]KAI5217307.1 hypothetical protein E4T40_07474 [Aureobasidium subglaciale]KAI5220937.1 hypothetical protein E4T41_07315 [Aureobasidium subglaciale]KAI5258495.1 hypothetical protein E4T46_07292 [Aureobasidium subglaciale]KEQ91259.1 hypothetical protein AUEXF2481DRAFT_33210 [Aureobasidium subglaciale EXF-2481]
MHFPLILACVLALACISTAAIDVCAAANGERAPKAEKPGRSSFAILIEPLRKVIDVFFRRRDLEATNEQVAHQPWTINTYPTYAHQDANGNWTVHVHGNIHKRQPYGETELNDILVGFLPRAKLQYSNLKFWEGNYHILNSTELDMGRPLAHDIASYPLEDTTIGAFMEACDEGSILPISSNEEGSFYGTITVSAECAPSFDKNISHIPVRDITLVPCNLRVEKDKDVQNTADVLFVPPRGVTIIADVDDTIREMNTWNPKQALLNVFVRPFRPWRDMPEVLRNLKQRIEAEGQNVHIHYLTDAPEPIARSYFQNMTEFFPYGSFDFRPMNFTSTRQMIAAREHNLIRLMESFPERRFISIGDTANSMERFPSDMNRFYPRIQCLIVRDVQATEPSDWLTPDTRKFLDLADTEYLFFRVPGDLNRLSGKHLAALSPPRGDNVTRTYGCFDTEQMLEQGLEPSDASHTRIKSYLTAAWWNIKCTLILSAWRPNHKCPLDRIAGTEYWDGQIEEEIEMEPLTDHMPVNEWYTLGGDLDDSKPQHEEPKPVPGVEDEPKEKKKPKEEKTESEDEKPEKEKTESEDDEPKKKKPEKEKSESEDDEPKKPKFKEDPPHEEDDPYDEDEDDEPETTKPKEDPSYKEGDPYDEEEDDEPKQKTEEEDDEPEEKKPNKDSKKEVEEEEDPYWLDEKHEEEELDDDKPRSNPKKETESDKVNRYDQTDKEETDSDQTEVESTHNEISSTEDSDEESHDEL